MQAFALSSTSSSFFRLSIMLYSIFRFELLYKLRRPETYLYFVLITLCSSVAVTFIFENTLGAVKENAPYVIASTMTISSAFMLLIVSMVMGMPILKDYQHSIDSILFTKPITKFEYFMGRFMGAFVVMLFVSSGLVYGIILGEYLPWRASEDLLPFQLWKYISSYVFFVLPTIFFTSALFFVSGALSKKLLVVYTQGILFFVAYIISMIILREGEQSFWGSMLDPFSFNTIKQVVKYWTPDTRNATSLPLSGIILYNRIIWFALGVLILLWGYYRFSFTVAMARQSDKRANQISNSISRYAEIDVLPSLDLPLSPSQSSSFVSNLRVIFSLSLFYCKAILREASFWAIVISAVAILLINSINVGTSYGVDSLPLTYLVIEELSEMSILFFLIIMIFFSGEVIWKERDAKISSITDALPNSTLVQLTGKFFGLTGIYCILLGILILAGILFQLSSGYYRIDIKVYIIHFFIDNLIFLLLYTALSFLLQSLFNHKFISHIILVICFLGFGILGPLGLSHPLYTFNAASLGTYSEMNGLGHFIIPYFSTQLYWCAIGGLILLGSALLIARGGDSHFLTRISLARQRFSKPILLGFSFFTFITIISGGVIFYNTNVISRFSFPSEEKLFRANYEKKLKQFQYLPQPKVVDVKLAVDIYPSDRNYKILGSYILINKESQPINTLHIQIQPAEQIELTSLEINKKHQLNDEFNDYDYRIFDLSQPLYPGDSIMVSFSQQFSDQGYAQSPVTDVVTNGTFFNNEHLPSIGYNSKLELREDDDRTDYKLPPKINKRPDRNHPYEVTRAIEGDDGYEITMEAIISTDSSQTAITSGSLIDTWQVGDRSFYHYKSDDRIINFYPILSADYNITTDQWISTDSDTVACEIYYHPSHHTNISRILHSMHASLDYYTEAFGAYGYDHLRIAEFPRYASYAQSFPGVIAYSEDLGFVLDIDDQEDVDMVFFVTAHEIAHQWWGLQLAAANVEGRNMLLESLAQYSAIMVLQEQYPQEKVEQFLHRERERYLEGRTQEAKTDKPLALVQSQKYIHYGKGAVNMYALQEYITPDSVNKGLHHFVSDWNLFTGGKQVDRYATTADLLEYFRAVTPDSLQYVISDLFESVILYDHNVTNYNSEKVAEHEFSVSFDASIKKYDIDSLGVQNNVTVHDLLDVGIYTMATDGTDSLGYRMKHWFKRDTTPLTITIPFEPTAVKIDPMGRVMSLAKN